MNKELLSVKEMAEYLGCGRTLSYKLLQRGPEAIPSYRVGKSLRIRREHLDEWLERNRSSDLHRQGSIQAWRNEPHLLGHSALFCLLQGYTICYLLLAIEGPIPSIVNLAKRVVLGPLFLGTLKNALCPQRE